MFELIPVMGDFLVGAVLAVFGNRVHEELPAQLRLLEIRRGLGRILLLKGRRGRALRQGRDGAGGDGGRLRPNDLGIALIRRYVRFILAVAWIDEEVKSAVSILHFGEIG